MSKVTWYQSPLEIFKATLIEVKFSLYSWMFIMERYSCTICLKQRHMTIYHYGYPTCTYVRVGIKYRLFFTCQVSKFIVIKMAKGIREKAAEGPSITTVLCQDTQLL